MIYNAFLVVGIFAAIHVITFGLWLKKEGNTAGFLLTLLMAVLAAGLPLFNVLRR